MNACHMLRGFAIDGKSANEVYDDFGVKLMLERKVKSDREQSPRIDSWACAIAFLYSQYNY